MKTFHIKSIYNQIFLHHIISHITHRTLHITFIIIVIIIIYCIFTFSAIVFFIWCAQAIVRLMIVGLCMSLWYVILWVTTAKYIILQWNFFGSVCNAVQLLCIFLFLFRMRCIFYVVCFVHTNIHVSFDRIRLLCIISFKYSLSKALYT